MDILDCNVIDLMRKNDSEGLGRTPTIYQNRQTLPQFCGLALLCTDFFRYMINIVISMVYETVISIIILPFHCIIP